MSKPKKKKATRRKPAEKSRKGKARLGGQNSGPDSDLFKTGEGEESFLRNEKGTPDLLQAILDEIVPVPRRTRGPDKCRRRRGSGARASNANAQKHGAYSRKERDALTDMKQEGAELERTLGQLQERTKQGAALAPGGNGNQANKNQSGGTILFYPRAPLTEDEPRKVPLACEHRSEENGVRYRPLQILDGSGKPALWALVAFDESMFNLHRANIEAEDRAVNILTHEGLAQKLQRQALRIEAALDESRNKWLRAENQGRVDAASAYARRCDQFELALSRILKLMVQVVNAAAEAKRPRVVCAPSTAGTQAVVVYVDADGKTQTAAIQNEQMRTLPITNPSSQLPAGTEQGNGHGAKKRTARKMTK